MSKSHGKDGKVLIKGYDGTGDPGELVTLCVKKWEGSLKKDKHDTSSTCNNEWKDFQVGKKVVEFSLEAQLDLTQDPLSATVDLNADYAATQLFADGTAEVPTFDMPSAIVEEIKITSMENDIITYTITGTSSGNVGINALADEES